MTLLHRFIVDEDAQDLLEYALLCTVIGLVGAGVFQLIMTAIGNTYGTWNAGVDTIADTPDPAGGS
jgi:Flp pilus assembly pilin Flp